MSRRGGGVYSRGHILLFYANSGCLNIIHARSHSAPLRSHSLEESLGCISMRCAMFSFILTPLSYVGDSSCLTSRVVSTLASVSLFPPSISPSNHQQSSIEDAVTCQSASGQSRCSTSVFLSDSYFSLSPSPTKDPQTDAVTCLSTN